jgi:hypothetical protein
MSISIFAVSFAIAVGSCVAAIILQPKRMRARLQDALVRQAAPAPAGEAAQLPAHEYIPGEDGPQPVNSCLSDRLQQHYGHVLIEPVPGHLDALVRHVEKLSKPARET